MGGWPPKQVADKTFTLATKSLYTVYVHILLVADTFVWAHVATQPLYMLQLLSSGHRNISLKIHLALVLVQDLSLYRTQLLALTLPASVTTALPAPHQVR